MIGSDNFDFTPFDEEANKTLMDAIRKLEEKLYKAEDQLAKAEATFEKMRLDILKYHGMGMGVESYKECDRNWLLSRYCHHVQKAQDYFGGKK
jgi:hypothetical protein